MIIENKNIADQRIADLILGRIFDRRSIVCRHQPFLLVATELTSPCNTIQLEKFQKFCSIKSEEHDSSDRQSQGWWTNAFKTEKSAIRLMHSLKFRATAQLHNEHPMSVFTKMRWNCVTRTRHNHMSSRRKKKLKNAMLVTTKPNVYGWLSDTNNYFQP